MLQQLFNYVVSPHMAFTHLVGGGLLWGMFSGGVSIKRIIIVAGLEELLCSFVWWLMPDTVRGLGAVFLLYVAISIYEQLTGPRVKVNEGAVFLADKSVGEVLKSGGDLITIREEPAQDGRVYIFTNLVYAEYWFTFWGGSSTKSAIDIGDIHGAEEGCEKAIVKSLKSAGIEPKQCFCLSVGTELSVTCAAQTTELRNQWVEGFRRCLGNKTDVYKAESFQRHFDDNAVPSQGEARGITLAAGLAVLQHFGRKGDKAYVKELFSTFAKIANTKSLDGEAMLTTDTFGKFLELVLKRPEIHQIYERLLYKKGEVTLSPQRLKDFLAEEQKEIVPVNECKAWIKQWESIIPFNSFSSVGFTSFLLSEEQAIMDRKCKGVYQDMTQPLSHYFIATSHNTYLTKGQLNGKSSVDAYTSAFEKGCKCVELDCWDGTNNEPVIYHGHTLTTKILFKDVIVAIRDNAFVTSQYPVILSFENHCSIDQQKVMATHLISILGDMIYTKPIPEDELHLPSPEQLKGYVIVKAKKLKGGLEDDEFDEDTDDDSDSDDGEEKPQTLTKSEKKARKMTIQERERISSVGGIGEDDILKLEKKGRKTTTQERERTSTGGSIGEDDIAKANGVDQKVSESKDAGSEVNGDEEHTSAKDDTVQERRSSRLSISSKVGSLMKKDKDSIKSKTKKEKEPKIAQELSDLVFYCQAVHFSNFAASKEKKKHYQMSSFGEKKALRFIKDDPVSLGDYNTRQLSRIYPAGSRVDSSNYDPQPLWNAGCQLVALNYQTPDKSMQLNHGLFADNGCCGYVLKPDFLRQEIPTFDHRGPFDDKNVRFLMVRVISGVQVPYTDEKKVRNDRSLHVMLTVKGVEADNQKEKTKSVKNNGYNPMWNDIIGFKIHVFELASLIFTLKEGDSFLGQYTIPLRCLQQGYRRVPLQNKSSTGKPHSSLFVHVELKDTN